MRTTRIVSLAHPWTTFDQERVSKKFLCQVDIFHSDRFVLVVHADITREQLTNVLPDGVPYRVDHSEVIAFKSPAAKS